MTVFLSFTILAFMTMFFVLIEMVHLKGENKLSDMLSDIGSESAFADYNRYLWDTYGILAIDSSYGTGQMPDLGKIEDRVTDYLNENGNPDIGGSDFFRMSSSQCQISQYGMLSDNGGAGFIREAAVQAKYSIPQQVIDGLKDQTTGDAAGSGEDVDQMITDGQKAIEEAKKEDEEKDSQESAGSSASGSSDKSADKVEVKKKASHKKTTSRSRSSSKKSASKNSASENSATEKSASESSAAENKEESESIIDKIADAKNTAVLNQIFGEGKEYSDASLSLSEPVSKRSLTQGNFGETEEVSAVDKALFADYEYVYFQNYMNDLGHPGLKYEWEYVLCGKDSDKANLEGVIERLILIREGANMAAILADPQKVTETYEAAIAIVGATANPLIIQAVQAGIMASWSYAESILDVRRIMDGGKVSAIKSKAEWTCTLADAVTAPFDTSRKAIDCASGIDYMKYLVIMSLVETEEHLGLRSLDVLENALHTQENYQNVKADQLIYRAEFTFEYTPDTIFFRNAPEIKNKYPHITYKRKRVMNYTDTIFDSAE